MTILPKDPNETASAQSADAIRGCTGFDGGVEAGQAGGGA